LNTLLQLFGDIMRFVLFLICIIGFHAQSYKTIEFESVDKLTVTADLYLAHDLSAPFIVLFHQAGWSRGEYLEIAPKLNQLGFNCMAVDQRSGKAVNDIINLTAKRAHEKNLNTRYIDAIPDMTAAIKFVKQNYAKGKIIAWGSSYSSALVLNLAGTGKIDVDAVLSFAPGEYFARQGQSKTFIQDAAKNLSVPTFITSAKNEHKNWKMIYDKINPKYRHSYLPETKGNHGSRALWEKFDDHQAYWNAVTNFLTTVKN
jgi:dienelactone hydrolase